MFKNSNTPLWLLFAGFLISGGAAFYQFLIAENYIVFANVVCDPTQYSCFVGDGETTPMYYKEVARPASNIPSCVWSGECAVDSCWEGEPLCEETYCEEGGEVICSN